MKQIQDISGKKAIKNIKLKQKMSHENKFESD